MSAPKVLTAVLGTIAFGVVAFGGAVASRLTESHDVACWDEQSRSWGYWFREVSWLRDGDTIVLRKGFPPRVVARVPSSVFCLAILSGSPE